MMSADQPTTGDNSAASSLDVLADVGQTRPDWTRGFERVVVKAGVHGKQHKPDLTSDTPRPACGPPDPTGGEWTAVEYDDSRARCRHQKCWGQTTGEDGGPPQRALDAAADPRQAGLDGWSQ